MIRSLVTFSLRPAIWQIPLISFIYVSLFYVVSYSIIFPSQSQISNTVTRTMYLSLKRELILSRLKVLVPRLTLFTLRSPHLGCDFLLFRLRHDLAAATTSHPDIIQRPSGSAYAIARKRRGFLVVMSSVLLHSIL